MYSRNSVSLSALVTALGLISAAMLGMSPGVAHAVTAKQLVGTWHLVSTTNTDAQGAKIEPFGPHPLGSYTFDAKGHFTQVIVPGEKDSATAVVAAFGDYSVTNGGKTLVLHIVGSQNSSANGKDLPRQITLTKDELKVRNSNPTTGGARAELVWKQVR